MTIRLKSEADFLCHSVAGHAARVRELLADLKAAPFDSQQWLDTVSTLISRAEYLANRADELAALCKEQK